MNKNFLLFAALVVIGFVIFSVISDGSFLKKKANKRIPDQLDVLGGLAEQYSNDYWSDVAYSDFAIIEYTQSLQEFADKYQLFTYHAPVAFDFDEQDKCCVGWKITGEGKEVGEVYVANGYWNYDKTPFFEKLNVVNSTEHFKFSNFNIKQITFTGSVESGIYYAESDHSEWPKAFVIVGYGEKPLSSDGQAIIEQYFASEESAKIFLQSILESHQITDVSVIEMQIENNIKSATSS